jgi:hypothetical protein
MMTNLNGQLNLPDGSSGSEPSISRDMDQKFSKIGVNKFHFDKSYHLKRSFVASNTFLPQILT